MSPKKVICFVAALVCFAVFAAGCAGESEPAPSEAPRPSASPERTEEPGATAAPSPTPTPYTELREGAQGETVTEASGSADGAWRSCAGAKQRIDDWLSLTRAAVVTFQRQNGLQADGIAGEETQELLYSGNAAECEPFSLLAPTVGMSFGELVMSDDGTRDQYPEGYPEPGTYKIIVDIEHQVTMVYTKDENGEYTVPVRYMLCSTGKDDCTPKGTFKMDNYRVRFSQFARDKTYGQYWSQIRGAIYFHTILYEEFDTSTYM